MSANFQYPDGPFLGRSKRFSRLRWGMHVATVQDPGICFITMEGDGARSLV